MWLPLQGPSPSAHTDWPRATTADFHLPSIAELMGSCTRKHGGADAQIGGTISPAHHRGRGYRALDSWRMSIRQFASPSWRKPALGEDARFQDELTKSEGCSNNRHAGSGHP